MAYRNLVTVTGQFNVREIMAHAHRKCAAELKLDREVSAIFYDGKPYRTYAEVFAVTLANAWSWSRTIRDAHQGEAHANAVPMFKMKEAA